MGAQIINLTDPLIQSDAQRREKSQLLPILRLLRLKAILELPMVTSLCRWDVNQMDRGYTTSDLSVGSAVEQANCSIFF